MADVLNIFKEVEMFCFDIQNDAVFRIKMQEAVCTESSDLSIAFLTRRGYNQTIDSNGAVGHLLTRSAVFVKKLSVLWASALRQARSV